MNDAATATLQPGLHPGIPMSAYLALPYLSSGLCNTLLGYSPLHAKFEQDHREDDATEASDTGTAIHDALLEGLDRIAVIEAKDWRTNAAKEARDFARATGQIPLLAHKVPMVEAAVMAASEFIASSELGTLLDGHPEQTCIWNEGDILCKSRPDWLSADHSVLLHVKTTKGSAGPLAFERTVDNMGYAVALAFYERGLHWCVGEGGDLQARHLILAIEQQPPFGCALYDLAPAKAAIAASKVERAIAAWHQCTATGRWPCYSHRVHSLEPKPWQLVEEETNAAFSALETAGGVPL